MQHFILDSYIAQGNKPAEAQLVRGFSENWRRPTLYFRNGLRYLNNLESIRKKSLTWPPMYLDFLSNNISAFPGFRKEIQTDLSLKISSCISL